MNIVAVIALDFPSKFSRKIQQILCGRYCVIPTIMLVIELIHLSTLFSEIYSPVSFMAEISMVFSRFYVVTL